ncbi:MAG: DUF2304 family protein [Eggerthellaceae bacterium]|nr:DUF2304 family protein [Eggerthellaceae bacterium]
MGIEDTLFWLLLVLFIFILCIFQIIVRWISEIMGFISHTNLEFLILVLSQL